jgi:hypothetical protein
LSSRLAWYQLLSQRSLTRGDFTGVRNKNERGMTAAGWKEILFVREIRKVTIPKGLSTEG